MTLDDMATAVRLERLRRGQLDAGFVRLPVDAEFSVLDLGADRLMLAVPPNIDTGPGVRELIERHGMVALVQTRGPGFVDQVQRYLAAEGIKLRVLQRANDLRTVMALVAAGIGVALVSGRAPVVVAAERVRWVPIEHEAARWRIGIAWGSGETAPALAAFLEVTREVAAEGWRNDS